MKFIAKWFAGQCEICGERKSVREVAQGELFVCEQCQPSGSQWFIGKCSVEACEHTSVSWDLTHESFLCWLHQSSVKYLTLATSSERR